MPTDLAAFAATLADLGWAALFLFVVIGAVAGLARQWWVPGWLYREEVRLRKAAESQLARNVVTIEALERIANSRGLVSERRHAESDDG